MAMASSTACWLSTGSEPGSPRQTGQTLVLGSSPNALGQPQNSLVAVLSSQWTSRPMTISQPGRHRPAPPGRRSGRRGGARGAAASSTAATWNTVALRQGRAEHLHARPAGRRPRCRRER